MCWTWRHLTADDASVQRAGQVYQAFLDKGRLGNFFATIKDAAAQRHTPTAYKDLDEEYAGV